MPWRLSRDYAFAVGVACGVIVGAGSVRTAVIGAVSVLAASVIVYKLTGGGKRERQAFERQIAAEMKHVASVMRGTQEDVGEPNIEVDFEGR